MLQRVNALIPVLKYNNPMNNQQLSKSTTAILIFAISFIVLALYFYGDPYINHHNYLRIVEQNIKDCFDWTCYKRNSFQHNLRGYQFFIFAAKKITRLPELESTYIVISFFSSFLIGALYFVTASLKKSLLIFLLFPIITIQVLQGEDNISYYGSIFLFYWFFLNKRKPVIAGILLGFSIFIHTSPLIFLGLAAYGLLDKRRWRFYSSFLITTVLSYLGLYLFLHPELIFDNPFMIIVHNPVVDYIWSITTKGTFTKETFLEGPAYFTKLQTGFELMLNSFQHVGRTVLIGYIAWSLILLALISNYKKIEGIKIYFILITTIPILIIEPWSGERYDFLILFLFYLGVTTYTNEAITLKRTVFAIGTLQALNLFAIFYSTDKYEAKKEFYRKEFLKINNGIKRDYYLFQEDFLLAEPLILSKLANRHKKIFFATNEGKYFQSNFSRFNKKTKTEREVWRSTHFGMWSSLIKPNQYVDLIKVKEPCIILNSKNSYYFEGEKESLKHRCENKD